MRVELASRSTFDIARRLQDMDTAGVDRAVLLGWYWENASTCAEQNRFLVGRRARREDHAPVEEHVVVVDEVLDLAARPSRQERDRAVGVRRRDAARGEGVRLRREPDGQGRHRREREREEQQRAPGDGAPEEAPDSIVGHHDLGILVSGRR